MTVNIVRYMHHWTTFCFWLLLVLTISIHYSLRSANTGMRFTYAQCCSDCDWDISYQQSTTFTCGIICKRVQNDFSSWNHKDKHIITYYYYYCLFHRKIGWRYISTLNTNIILPLHLFTSFPSLPLLVFRRFFFYIYTGNG